MVFTSSLSPGDWVYSRALKIEQSQSPPFPVGWGAMVTNDSCIIDSIIEYEFVEKVLSNP